MRHIKGLAREEGHERSPSSGFITLAQGRPNFLTGGPLQVPRSDGEGGVSQRAT